MPVKNEEKTVTFEKIDEVHKSEAILPVINAIFDIYNDRTNELQRNKAEITDRIENCQDKIAVLSETADRLSATNEMLSRLMDEHKIPKVASAVIAVNQAKINRIRENQIPKLENSINRDTKQIEKLDKRIETSSLKAERIKHLSGVIKSFTILNPAKRREQFAFHMDGMKACSNKLLENKISDETEKLNNLRERYEKADSAVEMYKLTEKISKQNNLVRDLKVKLNHHAPEFKEVASQQLDKTITKTENHMDNTIETDLSNPNYNIEGLPETILDVSSEYLRNTEIAMKDDFNMIDGIINNDSKEKKEEPMTALFSLKIFDEERNYKCDTLTADEMLHIAANSEKPILEMMKYGQRIDIVDYAEIQQSDKFKFSVEFDFNNGTAEIYSVNEDKGGIAEDDRNENNMIIKTIPLEAFVEKTQEIPKQEQTAPVKREKSKLINADVYKSIPQNQRVINNFPKKVALRIMDELENKGIPYSAMKKANNVMAITVSKENEATFKVAENTAKNEHLKYVHPEVYHQIPKEERHVQQMNESDVKQTISQLEKEKIPYSAVVNGDKSAVTINKVHAPKIATLSRKQMHEQAEALKREQSTQPKQKTKNNNIDH